MSSTIAHPCDCRRRRDRTAAILKAVACAAVFTLPSVDDVDAMIPLYVEDYRWDTRNQPAAMRLIGEHAVVYCEHLAANDGDAVAFDTPSGPKLIHYVGFRNIHYKGFHGGIDTDRSVHSTESNFYHTTDPATLTAWRRADGIELHWTPDARFVYGELVDTLPDAQDVVSRYRIDRYPYGQGAPDMQHEVDGVTGWVDAGADSATTYQYVLLSWNADETRFVEYSQEVLIVGTLVEDRPHFFAHKDDYLEKYYSMAGGPEDSTISVNFPLRFTADRPVDPSSAYLEIFRGTATAPLAVAGFAYDSATHTLSLIFPTDTADFQDHGGMAYRLVYDDPSLSEPIYFPPEMGGEARYMNTTINNRLMQLEFFAYEARIFNEDGSWPTYWDEYVELMQDLRDGYDFGGGITTFDGVFMDCVGGWFPSVQNRPYECTNAAQFRSGNVAAIQYLCASNPGFLHYLNTNDLELIEALDGTIGVAGTLDEKWPNWGGERPLSWEQHCLEAVWKSRAFPGMTMILEDARDYEYDLGDREQQLGAYLFVRHPDASVAAEKTLLGYGAWMRNFTEHSDSIPYPDDVVILPEQMLKFGDAVSDPFDIDWPDASEILSARISVDSAIDWFEIKTPGLIRETTTGARKFAFREYYVDGGDGTQYIAYAVADFSGASSSPTMVSLQEIFPDKAASTFYRLRLQGASPLITSGARLWTDAVGFDESWPTAADSVAIFFTQPVSSPEVVPAAVNTISGNPKYISTLRVLANHWNGQPLDIEVDCTNLNGNSAVHLYRTAHDDSTDMDFYQASIAGVVPGESLRALPFRATGTDGLMLFGNIDVVVDSGHTQKFRDFSSETGDLATIVSSPLAYVPINGDGGGVMDLLLTEATGQGRYLDAVDRDRFVPEFVDVTETRFGENESDLIESGTASLAAADFDGDGHEDFFACNNVGSRLYRYDPEATSYQIVTAAHFPSLPDTAFAASWCDYDRDGWVDLALAGVSDGVDGIHIYRNELNVFRQVQVIPLQLGGAVRDPAAPYPLVWADLNPSGGGRLELIAGTTASGVASLHVMARDTTYDKSMLRYTLNDDTDNVFPGGAPQYVSGLVLADLDGDGDQDLVVARDGGGVGAKALVFRNVGGQFVDVTAGAGVSVEDDVAAALVADMDPGGRPDLMTVPSVASGTPRLFLNESTSGIAFVEEAADLVPGAASGGLAYDWLGGKPNLYLAKSPTGGQVQNFYYGYVPPEGVLLGTVVRVRVGDTDFMNTSGIGTRVEVEWDGKHAYQWFDGGSGRGGQQARELVFDLGRVEGPVVVVRATWPDGVVSNFPMFHGGEDLLDVAIERSAQPIIDESSVTASFHIDAGSDNWYVFEWDADRQSIPEVHLEFVDPRSECSCGVASPTVELAWGVPDVHVWCNESDKGIYHHKLVWRNRCCDATSCEFQYKVRSRINGVVAESGTHAFRTPKYCPSN